MRLVSKYFWLQRWKSKREMAKSFYKQFDIQVNKKCLLALFPNMAETQIRAEGFALLFSCPQHSPQDPGPYSQSWAQRRKEVEPE